MASVSLVFINADTSNISIYRPDKSGSETLLATVKPGNSTTQNVSSGSTLNVKTKTSAFPVTAGTVSATYVVTDTGLTLESAASTDRTGSATGGETVIHPFQVPHK
jgi:hypothetical protein